MEKNIAFQPDDFKTLSSDAFAREEIVRPQTTYVKDVWRNFKKRKTAVVSLLVLLALVALVLVGPYMVSYNYYSNDYDAVNEAPSSTHWFGTDTLGRDL